MVQNIKHGEFFKYLLYIIIKISKILCTFLFLICRQTQINDNRFSKKQFFSFCWLCVLMFMHGSSLRLKFSVFHYSSTSISSSCIIIITIFIITKSVTEALLLSRLTVCGILGIRLSFLPGSLGYSYMCLVLDIHSRL